MRSATRMRSGIARLLAHPPGILILGVLALALAVGPSPTLSADDPPGPTIVVTTDVLGSVVRELVADDATVIVLMGGGVDPHAWAPSARDVEAIQGADLVVANGLHLEEGLVDVLAGAAAEGVPVFEATDHVAVRPVGGAASHEARDAAGDPHFWLDPLAMRDVVVALVPVLAGIGVDASARGAELAGRLEALAAEVADLLAAVPPGRRRLVTGHESMGYFADRFGFELVGALVPGLSSQGEVSAGELADLVRVVREAGVTAMFTEVGASAPIADALAAETGATVVELGLERIPPDGSYETLIRDVAQAVAGALAG